MSANRRTLTVWLGSQLILAAALIAPDAKAQTWTTCTSGSTQGSTTCTATANVGVATQGPQQKLDINGNIRINQHVYSGASYTGFLTDAGAALPIKAGSLVLSSTFASSAPTNGMYVQGSVGIGQQVPDPNALLHVEGAAITTAPGQPFVVLKNTHGNAGDQFGLAFRNTGFAGSASINSYLDAGGATSRLQFLTGGTTPSVAVTIDGLQNVGIGQPNPAYKLDVAGDAHFTGNVTGGSIHATYQDIAEWVPASEQLAPGTVVVLNPTQSNVVMRSEHPYDTSVAGVVSDRPGLVLGARAHPIRQKLPPLDG